MDNNFPKLQLDSFTRGFDDFHKAVCQILRDADENGSLIYLIPDEVDAQYRYSDYKRDYRACYDYINDHFLDLMNTDRFLSFLNEVISCQNKSFELSRDTWKSCPGLKESVFKLADLIGNINNPAVFKLDFYFDPESIQIKRKLDAATTETINGNLEGGTQVRYEQAVAEFLSYKKDLTSAEAHFYNDSLNNLKKVVENTLENNFTDNDGRSPRLHNEKEISNIIIGSRNPELEQLICYIIKNIHHEAGGQPKKFTEKEYVYLWLELNKILYLLNRYAREGAITADFNIVNRPCRKTNQTGSISRRLTNSC
jgi:hypothetical protein